MTRPPSNPATPRMALAAVLGWGALTGLLLLLPADLWQPTFQAGGTWASVAAHVALLGGLAWLLGRSLGATGVSRPRVVAAVVATLYGAALEALQHLVPGRAPDVVDVVVNGLAAAVGAWLAGRR